MGANRRPNRPKLGSLGRPGHQREVRRRFWRLIGHGLQTHTAASLVGVPNSTADNWFADAGGMTPIDLAEPSGRYLSFSEREEIAVLWSQGHSVRAATDIAQAFHHSHNVPVTILKVFNAFGPRQKGVSPVRKIVPQFIRSAIRNEDLPIYGDGEQVIDMVPIGTVAEAFVAAVTHAPGCGEVIEVGTGVTTRVVEVAEAIKEHVGSSSGFRYLGNRLGEGKEHRAADTNLLEQLLGVSPSKSIRSELNKTVDWYLKNRTWLMLDQLDPSTS